MRIWIILAGCLGLRLISLNQSLWLDEAISANVVKNNSYEQIVSKFSPTDFHPPLYYLVLKAWTDLFGYSEISLRMPSVIFSLVTVYVVYLLAGNGAALLAGVNPLLVYYSQEARMYTMATMLVTLAVYCLVKKKYWWYNIWSGLSFLTFYGVVFFTVAIGLYWLVKKRYQELLITNIGITLAIVGLWPLLEKQIHNSQEMLFSVKNWSLVLGKVNLKNLILIPLKFTSGRISFYPKIIYWAVTAGWMMYVGWQVMKNRMKSKFYTYLLWSTLTIGIIFSMFTPMMQYFRFLFLVPLMAIIIKKNIIVTAGFTIFSLIYLLMPNMWREDWRGVATSINKAEVYMISSFADPIMYYRPELRVKDIRGPVTETAITVIPYGETIHGVDHRNILTNYGYKLTAKTNFREISVENWKLGN